MTYKKSNNYKIATNYLIFAVTDKYKMSSFYHFSQSEEEIFQFLFDFDNRNTQNN